MSGISQAFYDQELLQETHTSSKPFVLEPLSLFNTDIIHSNSTSGKKA